MLGTRARPRRKREEEENEQGSRLPRTCHGPLLHFFFLYLQS